MQQIRGAHRRVVGRPRCGCGGRARGRRTRGVPGEDQAVTPAKRAAPVTRAAVSVDVTPMAFAAAQPVTPNTTPSPVTFALRNVVQPILSSILGALPKLPTESPLAWVFLAA